MCSALISSRTSSVWAHLCLFCASSQRSQRISRWNSRTGFWGTVWTSMWWPDSSNWCCHDQNRPWWIWTLFFLKDFAMVGKQKGHWSTFLIFPYVYVQRILQYLVHFVYILYRYSHGKKNMVWQMWMNYKIKNLLQICDRFFFIDAKCTYRTKVSTTFPRWPQESLLSPSSAWAWMLVTYLLNHVMDCRQ